MGFVGAESELVLIARAANIECELNQLSASLKPPRPLFAPWRGVNPVSVVRSCALLNNWSVFATARKSSNTLKGAVLAGKPA